MSVTRDTSSTTNVRWMIFPTNSSGVRTNGSLLNWGGIGTRSGSDSGSLVAFTSFTRFVDNSSTEYWRLFLLKLKTDLSG